MLAYVRALSQAHFSMHSVSGFVCAYCERNAPPFDAHVINDAYALKGEKILEYMPAPLLRPSETHGPAPFG